MDQILLKPKHFRIAATQRGHAAVVADKSMVARIKKCSERDREVAEALKKVQNLGPPRLQRDFTEWNAEQGLLLFRGCVYVPKDAELRRDIVKLHHDSLSAGHPGRAKTLELVSRNYWWPGMYVFVKNYVAGCALCQQMKVNTHPTSPGSCRPPRRGHRAEPW